MKLPAAVSCARCRRTRWRTNTFPRTEGVICAECDTKETGQIHPPSIPVTPAGFDEAFPDL